MIEYLVIETTIFSLFYFGRKLLGCNEYFLEWSKLHSSII